MDTVVDYLSPVADYLSRVAKYDWWVVGIELFLIGLVVYWVIDFLEGTRGERLFRGVILILVVGVLVLNLVVEQLGFLRLQYLYKGFLIAVLIIAVAAFQPEIRRVLIRLGQPHFLSGGSGLLSGVIEQVISAVGGLSSNQTGAIIVFEGRVGLGEFIETGVRLDAKVTSELLRSIFYTGGALHNMAVVIRGERIVAAKVQLPLAEGGSIGGAELGSRHRAAIGITRGSDALCVVVSEESGTVSVAKNGKLRRGVDEDALRKYLAGTV